MVRRKLNKPVAKVCNIPVFWLHEIVTSEWSCNGCKKRQQKGAVAFEVWLRNAQKGVPKGEKKDSHWRAYLCMSCAAELLESSMDKVNIVKRHGADGFRMFEAL